MKKALLLLCIAVLFVLLAWVVFSRLSERRGPAENRKPNIPVAVEVSPILKRTIQDEGRFTGSLYPFAEFVLAPKIGGRVERILIRIGDRVQPGQMAAVLDDAELRQEVIQAGAELEVARANLQERRNTLERAKRELDRTEALRRKKIASESQLDAAVSEFKTQEAMVKVATAQVAQKEAALKTFNVRLSYAQIQVPGNQAEGYLVVGERFVDEGAMLAPNTPIASILDISTLVAVIHVIERDYPKIRQGLQAVVSTDAFPDSTFEGKVVRIAPFLREKSREARVEIEVPNPGLELKPGMFVRVELTFSEHEDATVVPAAAVVKRNGRAGVFMADLEARTARFVPVSLGIVNGILAEVVSPPLDGSVVTLGHHLLEDGAPILLPGPPQGGKAPAAGRN